MSIKPNGAYIVIVEDDRWAAHARDGIVVPRGQDIDAIDLSTGCANPHRRSTTGCSNQRARSCETVRLVQTGRELTEQEMARLDKPAGFYVRLLRPQIGVSTVTDAEGRFNCWQFRAVTNSGI